MVVVEVVKFYSDVQGRLRLILKKEVWMKEGWEICEIVLECALVFCAEFRGFFEGLHVYWGGGFVSFY